MLRVSTGRRQKFAQTATTVCYLLSPVPNLKGDTNGFYLISYDIAEKDAFEYDNLWEKLKQMNAVRILYSEWAVSYPAGQATNIYNAIAKCVQGKDRLLVQEMTGTAAWDKLLVTDDRFRQLLLSAA